MSDPKIDQGQQWLEQALVKSGFVAPISVIEPPVSQLNGCWLKIHHEALTPEQRSQMLGNQGQLLNAFQYLLNSTLNLGLPKDEHLVFTLELGDFRSQRYQELVKLSESVAEKVKKTKQPYEFPALPAVERRIIHTLLQEYPELHTESQGQEPDRHLVVTYQPESVSLEPES